VHWRVQYEADGTIYLLARRPHGAECDCPDFVFHRDGLDPAGCKHIKALAACGVLDTAPTPAPAAHKAAAGWPDWTDAERVALGPDPADDDDAAGFDPYDPDYLAEMRAEGGEA
jgi:hypothetical protein